MSKAGTLDKLLAGSVASAVHEYVGAGPLRVVGWPRLQRALEDLGYAVGDAGGLVWCEPSAGQSFRDGVAALAPGSKVVLVTRGQRRQASTAMLCAGLVDLWQQQLGRRVVTGGIV